MHPGAVPDGATVSLQCACGLKKYRYVIVQFPINDRANFCEVEVYVRGKFETKCNFVYSVVTTWFVWTEKKQTQYSALSGSLLYCAYKCLLLIRNGVIVMHLFPVQLI